MKKDEGDAAGSRPYLVLGVGSILMKDEGVGVWAVEELKNRYRFPDNVDLVDGGTSGLDLITYISKRPFVIIIDAIQAGMPPGTVLKVEGEDVPARFRTRISPHQLGISDLLAAAALTDELPGEIVLLGIEPKIIQMGLGLSEEVKTGLDKLLDAVVAELNIRGCFAEPLSEEERPVPDSIWGRP